MTLIQTRTAAAVLITALLLTLAGPARAQSDDLAAGLKMFADVEPIALTESDIEGFIAASKALDEQGVDLDVAGPDAPPTQAGMIDAMKANSEAMAIIEDNGFSAEEFSDVTLNIVLAIGAAELAANRAEIDAAMQQMEAMKDQLPPEQYAAIREQVLGMQMMFEKAPPANIELVQRYRPQLEAIGN